MGKVTEAIPPQVLIEEAPISVEETPCSPTLISLMQLEHIGAAEAATERIERLQSALGADDYLENSQTSAWVDFCFSVLNFAQEDALFPLDKSLCLLTIAHEVYVFATESKSEAADSTVGTRVEPMSPSSTDLQEIQASEISTPKVPLRASPDAYPAIEAVYDQFREKIRRASGVVSEHDALQVNSSAAASLAIAFSPVEVKQIVAFFTTTFFRHVRAYQYLCRVPRLRIVRECPLPTEAPLLSPGLDDAVPQSESCADHVDIECKSST